MFHGFYMYEDRLLPVQEWWLSDRLYILKDRPAVFGNPDYQKNVMLRCGVPVITMGMVGRFLMISQKIVFGSAE